MARRPRQPDIWKAAKRFLTAAPKAAEKAARQAVRNLRRDGREAIEASEAWIESAETAIDNALRASSDYVRVSPKQAQAMGLAPKSRPYVLKGIRNPTKTQTITHRAYQTKVAREHGFANPEAMTEARRQRALAYKNISAESAAEKNKKIAFDKRAEKLRAKISEDFSRGLRVENQSYEYSTIPEKRRKRHGANKGYWFSKSGRQSGREISEYIIGLRERRLQGDRNLEMWEYKMLKDYARYYKDRELEATFNYPPSFGVRDAA